MRMRKEERCVCVRTEISVQLDTGKYTLAYRLFSSRKRERQTDEHHTNKRERERKENCSEGIHYGGIWMKE